MENLEDFGEIPVHFLKSFTNIYCQLIDFADFFLSEENAENFAITDSEEELQEEKDEFKFDPKKHIKKGLKWTAMSSKTAHYYVLNYQYDFIDMQAEVMKLTGIIRILKNLPSPNRTKDMLLIKWRIYRGVTPTDEWKEELRTLKSILNTFRRRRSFVWCEMMERMVEMHVKWHFYGDQLQSEGISRAPTRRLNPFPYKFNEIRLKIAVQKLPKLFQTKVNYFRSKGRFQDAVQELPIFGKMTDPAESDKTGSSEDVTNEILEEKQPMDQFTK